MKNELNRKDLLPFDENTIQHFCPVPFFQLSLHTSGKVTPCCRIGDYHLGDIQRNNLADIWNGPELRALRKEFLKGKIKTCLEKQKEMRCHLLYERFLPFIDLQEFSSKLPQRLDIRLNSKCNLRCKMCHNWKGDSGVYQDYFDENQYSHAVLKNVKEISLLGGEPFIQKSTFDLIQKVSQLNPQCLWLMTTNLNYNFDSILPSLDKIRLSCLQLSLDSLNKETYQEIRRQGNFELAMQNLDHFIAYKKKYEKERNETFRLQASLCVQKDNYKEIGSFIEFCRQKDINYHFQFAYQPYELSLLSLPESEQEEILSSLIDLCDEESTNFLYPVIAALSKNQKDLCEEV